MTNDTDPAAPPTPELTTTRHLIDASHPDGRREWRYTSDTFDIALLVKPGAAGMTGPMLRKLADWIDATPKAHSGTPRDPWAEGPPF